MNAQDVAEQLLSQRIALTGYLRAFVGERGTAEDLFQEVTVRAIGNADEFGDSEAFAPLVPPGRETSRDRFPTSG